MIRIIAFAAPHSVCLLPSVHRRRHLAHVPFIASRHPLSLSVRPADLLRCVILTHACAAAVALTPSSPLPLFSPLPRAEFDAHFSSRSGFRFRSSRSSGGIRQIRRGAGAD